MTSISVCRATFRWTGSVYSSRDDRTEGMFGQGWSVMYEVSLERTPGTADENCMTFVSGMGRRLDMEAVLPGSGFYSPGEGLAVRRVSRALAYQQR